MPTTRRVLSLVAVASVLALPIVAFGAPAGAAAEPPEPREVHHAYEVGRHPGAVGELALGSIHDLTPDGLPPESVPWLTVGLTGGPVYQLAVSLGTEGGQRVVAAGNEVFTSDRAVGWKKTPNRTGPVDNVVAGPDGALYAASSGGVGYRTKDYGGYWYETRLRGDAPIRFLAVSPDFETDEMVLAITLEDWRMYRADRGGMSWNELIIEAGADPRYEFAAAAFSLHYAVDETFFVGTDHGVFKTEDAGLHWELKSGPEDGAPAFGEEGGPASSQGLVLPREYGDNPDRRFDPILETVLAYNAHGIYLSEDDAVTWRKLDLDVEQVNSLVVSNGWPDDPVLLAAVTDPSGAVGAVSTDGGDTWDMVEGQDGLAGTSAAMAFDFDYIPPEVNPDLKLIYLPTTLKDWELGKPSPVFPESPPTGSREMYLATDGGGVWRSRDLGATWDRRSWGLTNVQVTAMSFLPGGPDGPVLAGTGAAGIFKSRDGGRSWRWQDVGLPRGEGATIHKLELSPEFERDRTVFIGTDEGVWTSRDGGASWSPPSASSPAPATTLDVSADFGTDRTLVASGKISTDAGASWEALSLEEEWQAVAISPQFAADRTIWVGTLLPPEGRGYTLWRSDDAGESWVLQEESLLRNRDVTDIDVLSVVTVEPNRVFVATSRGLVVSHDNGGEWERVSAMPREAYAVDSLKLFEAGIGQTGIVLSAGRDGAAWSTDRGIDWVDEPEAPEYGSEATISHDGSVFAIAVPVGVARYGEGSARIFLPVAHQPE